MIAVGLFELIVEELDEADIPHMVAGSTASSYHGEPRSTQDIDLVIDPTAEALQQFIAALAGHRLAVGDALGALEHRGMFNVVDVSTGWKVDLVIRKDRPFSRSEFDRREPMDLGGVQTFVATIEDTILAKLEWGHESASERQLRDVVGMLRVGAGRIDNAHLDSWAVELGLEDDLARARTAATR